MIICLHRVSIERFLRGKKDHAEGFFATVKNATACMRMQATFEL